MIITYLEVSKQVSQSVSQ